MAYAHSSNAQGVRHELVKHLTDVAIQAKGFAEPFGAGDLAYCAGLWHDLGKFHPQFQQYLLECEKTPSVKRYGPDHKRAGALLARQYAAPLALLIQGHHGGLHRPVDVPTWVEEESHQDAIQTSLGLARAAIGDGLESARPEPPLWTRADKSGRGMEFFLRMLFSALVDADCLDTERHFNPERAQIRGKVPAMAELWTEFEVKQLALLAAPPDTNVNRVSQELKRVRREVYFACLEAASQPPGFFRLTVPTGGGKTRSSLAFALRHALAWGHERVIVAIPYTSIIEQTAQVYRGIFDDSRAVLEHHSAVTPTESNEDSPVTAQMAWARLAADNWDASIIVTTNVQLFQSLLGHRTGGCRKLHNVARSVIVLDEVQTLPPQLIEPTLDVLRELVAHYGVSVVLCTATQPALEVSPGFNGLADVREIVADPARHFATLERVDYEWPLIQEPWTWERVAAELRQAPGGQAMAIVNTKADAMSLLDALNDPAAFHLSTLLCGAHRRVVLEKVRARLAEGKPCLLVSTQVVEAGVDLDFPLVLRAAGPLDRIVQAAGRCNREGRLPTKGRVVIFEPSDGHQPPWPYGIGTSTTSALVREANGVLDLHDPEVYRRYFRLFYQVIDLDRGKVQQSRAALNYPEVAKRYRLIEDDGSPVVVPYPSKDDSNRKRLLEDLKRHPERSRAILRQLQPFIVSVRQHEIDKYATSVVEVMPGLWEWHEEYDNLRGIGGGKVDVD